MATRKNSKAKSSTRTRKAYVDPLDRFLQEQNDFIMLLARALNKDFENAFRKSSVSGARRGNNNGGQLYVVK